MTDRVSEGRPQVLLVEGKTDEIFVGRLWERRQLKIRNWAIRPKNSVEALLDSIKNEVNVSDREVLGIIVDANNSLNNRWRAIRGRLQNANIDAPVCADPCGTVIEATLRTPRVGVWIMPDNVSSGELEDFVGQMVPPRDPVWPKSKTYIQNIPDSERKFTAAKEKRAIVHAWLAVRKNPRQIGQAVLANDLDIDNELCTRFSNWLIRLFG